MLRPQPSCVNFSSPAPSTVQPPSRPSFSAPSLPHSPLSTMRWRLTFPDSLSGPWKLGQSGNQEGSNVQLTPVSTQPHNVPCRAGPPRTPGLSAAIASEAMGQSGQTVLSSGTSCLLACICRWEELWQFCPLPPSWSTGHRTQFRHPEMLKEQIQLCEY